MTYVRFYDHCLMTPNLFYLRRRVNSLDRGERSLVTSHVVTFDPTSVARNRPSRLSSPFGEINSSRERLSGASHFIARSPRSVVHEIPRDQNHHTTMPMITKQVALGTPLARHAALIQLNEP